MRSEDYTLLLVTLTGPNEVSCRFKKVGAGAKRWSIPTDNFLKIAERLARKYGRPLIWPEGRGRLGRGIPVEMGAALFAMIYASWRAVPAVKAMLKRDEVQIQAPWQILPVMKKARVLRRASVAARTNQ